MIDVMAWVCWTNSCVWSPKAFPPSVPHYFDAPYLSEVAVEIREPMGFYLEKSDLTRLSKVSGNMRIEAGTLAMIKKCCENNR
ncbi:hypothetical protein GGR25_003458 [Kaistia hirudinis]|uniref:Uncharacterized protein n=1 Tax=Kaistia hirudinis TaxID=1293440 RepID=A0A840APW6_9HYPH|nr:hypothetical protein [Kaistia hirudinis]MBB3932400.1 hypothetical protein [Kaistia hirudinis]